MAYLTTAERIGREQGRQEGEREKARAMAKKRLAKGMDLPFIKKVTGLSDTEIAALMH